MNLAVLTRQGDPFSLAIYREQIVRELSRLGILAIPFGQKEPVPEDADIVWEPCLAGARKPEAMLRRTLKPIVATVHGAAPFSMPWRDIYPSFPSAVRATFKRIRTRTAWRWFRKRASAFIAVSHFGAQEVARTFKLSREIVHPIYHGIDHTVFLTGGHRHDDTEPYWLHISRGARKKNVRRIIDAYTTVQKNNRCNLMLVLPEYRETVTEPGVIVIRDKKSPVQLASLYRGARGFIFPSLHETFGMPIIEAMACGCPVITSRDTACAEIAGDAALLVDPRSVSDIAAALHRFINNDQLLKTLREKGLARAKDFSWRKSAQEHLVVFRRILEGRS